MKLSVSHILESDAAVFHDEGLRVYDQFSPYLEKQEIVELSFLGITTCSTQFLNACVGKAYLTNPAGAKKYLKVVDYAHMPLFETKLLDVIENASDYEDYQTHMKSALA